MKPFQIEAVEDVPRPNLVRALKARVIAIVVIAVGVTTTIVWLGLLLWVAYRVLAWIFAIFV